jgi:hypothetical protein
MRRVIIESPYAGETERNITYARAAVRDSLQRGEAPVAWHLLYTQPRILDDGVADERQWGIRAGLAWLAAADAVVAYIDRGITLGMQSAIAAAEQAGMAVEYRSLITRDAPW